MSRRAIIDLHSQLLVTFVDLSQFMCPQLILLFYQALLFLISSIKESHYCIRFSCEVLMQYLYVIKIILVRFCVVPGGQGHQFLVGNFEVEASLTWKNIKF